MFKHILAPTDGSASSELALQSIMRFAHSIGARVTRGRSGVQGAAPASETREVLAHTPLPVLVFH